MPPPPPPPLLLLSPSPYDPAAQGEHEEAIASSGQAIKARPDHVEAIYFRGKIYYTLGEYDFANNHMTSCLKQDPEHKKCKDMFRLLKKIGNLRKAADAATAAVTPRQGKDDALRVGDVWSEE